MYPAAHVLQVLDELQDLLVVEHCLDIITWLEQHKALLSSPAYKGGLQQVTGWWWSSRRETRRQ
jgi:hypothetical protein